MNTFVILLRAVTPTGKNKVPMAPLRAALEHAGLAHVRTYIQSGNVVARSTLNRSDLETLVHEVIKREFGGDIAVLARTAEEFRAIAARNPFPHADGGKLHVTLLAATPDAHFVDEFLAVPHAPDEVRVIGDSVYVLCAAHYSDAKANNAFIERKLHVRATTRVYRTITKLIGLSTDG